MESVNCVLNSFIWCKDDCMTQPDVMIHSAILHISPTLAKALDHISEQLRCCLTKSIHNVQDCVFENGVSSHFRKKL